MAGKIKVYELASELKRDSKEVVEVIQRLGIDIRNPMSLLGSEEVTLVRDYYKKNSPAVSSPSTVAKGPVTETRVGRTVIRRRSRPKPSTPAPTPPSTEAPTTESTEEGADTKIVTTGVSTDKTESAPKEKRTIKPILKRSQKPAAPKPVKKSAAAPPVETETKAADSDESAPMTPSPQKRFIPSILKKVATEQYLGEKVGPKPPKKELPKKGEVAASGANKEESKSTDKPKGPKRVREIALTPAAPPPKEGRRRIMQRQDTVFRSADFLKRELVQSSKRRKSAVQRSNLKTQITMPAEHKRTVEMGESIRVSELAQQLSVKVGKLIEKLMGLGVEAGINETIDFDTATLIASEFEYTVTQKVFREEDYIAPVDESAESLESRAPVVTVMGHVDHGKTSVLDAIRRTKVVDGESGGITQHIGAYTVSLPKGKISFIDTPGHEAFTAMRARGAGVTDIVILVVSATEGCMPQTVESINHAKAASVPIIVAVNKIDLPDANPDKIKQTLASYELNPEEWGGDTIYVNVSAKTGKGLDQLLESVLLQAELLELKANHRCPARGVIIESRLDKGRGAVSTVLIQAGKLKSGDLVSCGGMYGKIRALTDFQGKKIKVAGPSDAVEILGLPSVAETGALLAVMENERQARELTQARVLEQKEKDQLAKKKLSLEEMMAGPAEERELRLVLKGDVQGSVEAVKDALMKFPSDKVQLRILHAATGGITGSDVMLASASDAVIFGFSVRPDVKAKKIAEKEGVEIRTYRIIYELLEDAKKLLEGLVAAEIHEKVIGRAEVRETFQVPKVGTIAGSAVIDGKVTRGCFLRLLRNSRVVYEGKLSSLRRFKDDVKEVSSGFECGIGLENFNDLKTGDQLEAFIKEEVRGSL